MSQYVLIYILVNIFAVAFLVVSTLALLFSSKQQAGLPLLIGACYMTLGQQIQVGPFHFTVIRMLLIIGFIRTVLKREYLKCSLNRLDYLIFAFGLWGVLSSFFHTNPKETLVTHLGLVYNILIFYYLIRVFYQSYYDIIYLISSIALLLTPICMEMVLEQVTGRNLFSLLGGVPAEVSVRGGHLRAQGPFAHAILAGTVGAVCFPLFVGIYQTHRNKAILGAFSSLGMVLTSVSSGPIMSFLFGFSAFVFWPWRRFGRHLLIGLLAIYLLLAVFMDSPPYFLMARLDLTGSSTGWHRAELMRSSFSHLNEWWFAGTDYTRHWMPTGVSWSKDHADITNQYLEYGVVGGLALMMLFVCSLGTAFKYIGKIVHIKSDVLKNDKLLAWGLGSSLFAHVTTCISVSYFDQSFIFLYLVIGAISSLQQYVFPRVTHPKV